MNRTTFVAVGIVLALAHLTAQDQTATTSSGREVVLHDDGTWNYVEDQPNKNDEGWTSTKLGSLKIDRFWEESFSNYNVVYVLVTYRNTTERTFSRAVTIRATILDGSRSKIDTNSRSFFSFEHGPIGPGFEGDVKIPIECAKGVAKYVSVAIETAN